MAGEHLHPVSVMLSASLAGFQDAHTQCDTADQLAEDTETQLKHIVRLHPRLQFLRNEWLTQAASFQLLQRGFSCMATRFQTLKEEKSYQLETVDHELHDTLAALRQRVIEPCLQPKQTPSKSDTSLSPSPSPQKLPRTLYDLIDDQGVDKIRHDAHNLVERIQRVAGEIDRAQQALRQFSTGDSEMASDVSLDRHQLTHIQSQRDKQVDECQRMHNELAALANHCHQLESVSRDPGLLTEENLLVLERDTQELSAVVSELQEGLQFVRAIHEEVNIRAQQYDAIHHDLKTLLRQLNRAMPTVQQLFRDLAQIKWDCTNLFPDTDLLLSECAGLHAWYTEFSRSYDHLLVELDRRRRMQAQHMKMAQEFASHLAMLHDTETRERDAFTQTFGQYLPIDLCTPLMVPPAQYTLTTVQDPGSLPQVPDAALHEAKVNIANRSMAAAPCDG
ncbi:hypothetical protein H4R34_000716 [Dimargaris verticillata]|uniref:Autophagy-related protein 17 n=1 Tax=Dimargaris verticillata TaxID=2761393 RepID=A0A9W8BB94_9FUNG|nr:hypothetical protein H4R34_000716 [Dimargaris verticillata]